MKRYTSISDHLFSGCSALTSITIPDSVTSIGYSAFSRCDSLTSVTIPASVTTIGVDVFGECSALKEILVHSENSAYSSVDGVLFNKDQSRIISYPGGKAGAYSVPDSVTSIEDSAFKGCSSLTSVTMPDSVTSIGDSAFFDCDSLTEMTISDGLTYIGKRAFEDCHLLNEITIPDDVTKIEMYTFNDCSALERVTIGDNVTEIDIGAFSGCKSLASIFFKCSAPVFQRHYFVFDIFEWVTATAYYPADNPTWTEGVRQDYGGNITWMPWNPSEVQLYENTLKLPESATTISSEAFAGLTQGVNIDVPSTVTSIADDAFEDSAVVIIGDAGGYVEEFCDEHEIPFSAR